MTNHTPLTWIGKEVRRLRLAKGWSQARLNREAGIASVAAYESGERKEPGVMQAQAMCKALGVTVDELIKGSVKRGGK